jgi:integrase/recombinase XerC
MADLVKNQQRDLVERARDFAGMSEDALKHFAAEACRDRDAGALWALPEAHLTLHGSSGAHVSSHTLSTYRYGALELLRDWEGENLLRPSRNAGVLWVRELEARHASPGTVHSRLSGAKALYAALRWSGATDAAPFTDVRPARDRTLAWEKRQAHERWEVTRLEAYAEGGNLLIVLLGAHAGLRVSEMTALRWEDVDLSGGTLTVREGKGNKTARVSLSASLVRALEQIPPEERLGHVLPCRSRQAVFERLETLCRHARVTSKGVHALRHSAGTRLRAETGDLSLVADHLRHASLDMARSYAKVDNVRLKKAVGEW